jgi:hypothetical protein
MGAQSTHAPCVYQIFNDLGADFAGETSRIAREEPTSPANLLILNKLKLAERVGFAPLPVVENKELKGFHLPHDPPDPHESLGRDTY